MLGVWGGGAVGSDNGEGLQRRPQSFAKGTGEEEAALKGRATRGG